MSAVCRCLASTSLAALRRSPSLRRQTSPTTRQHNVSTSAMASETKKTSISSYLPADTYNSLKPGDGDLTFLHTMLRVRGLARVSVHC